jgi:hypothetical protein
MDIDGLVSRYIALRDKKAEYKAEYDGKVAKVDDLLRKVEGVLLKHFQDTGVESVRTESGTAYTSTRSSAKVVDWDSFLAFVKESDSWDMLEHRCAKTVVEEYKNENGDLPPGLNWSSEVTVGIRRGK